MLYFTGDIHGDILHRIYRFRRIGVQRDKPNALIVAGDFGALWYPPSKPHLAKKEQRVLDSAEEHLSRYNVTMYFVDGNHENYDLLYEIPIDDDGTRHIRPHIRHMPRGTIHTINGCDVFAFGGAMSTDRGMESLGVGYWTQELPNPLEFQRGLEAVKAAKNIDFVVTHAAPGGALSMMSDVEFKRLSDPTVKILEEYRMIIEERFPHAHWYFGHYHKNVTFTPVKGFTNLTYTCIYGEIEPISEQEVHLEREKPREIIPQRSIDPAAPKEANSDGLLEKIICRRSC